PARAGRGHARVRRPRARSEDPRAPRAWHACGADRGRAPARRDVPARAGPRVQPRRARAARGRIIPRRVNRSLDDARRERSIGVAGVGPGINAMVELDGPWHVVALANFDPPSAMATVKAVMALIPGRARRGPPSAPRRPSTNSRSAPAI